MQFNTTPWTPRSSRFGAICARLLLFAIAALFAWPARAADNLTMIQWFENRWENIEHRMPDFFMSYYNGVWLPPASKASDYYESVGYDPFDRFDLGSPGSETAYGTAADFDALVDAFHDAGTQVFLDIVMNHNGSRTGNVTFQEHGGWPGFWMNSTDPVTEKFPGGDWGDFHDGTTQSHDPGGGAYDLFNGDLVQLVDIAQESNHQFIRHPVDENNPANIPPGTYRNRPNPANYALYPDRDLPGDTFTNPGAHGNAGGTVTIYPFNTADPMQGDPVTDNTTGMLMRWTQWMLDMHHVDGFRLDAAKHIPSWFWDSYWDNVVFHRRTTAAGTRVTAYSFVESVEGNSWTYNNYVRKDGFGNRDALDLNGAGALRDLRSAGGFGLAVTHNSTVRRECSAEEYELEALPAAPGAEPAEGAVAFSAGVSAEPSDAGPELGHA